MSLYIKKSRSGMSSPDEFLVYLLLIYLEGSRGARGGGRGGFSIVMELNVDSKEV